MFFLTSASRVTPKVRAYDFPRAEEGPEDLEALLADPRGPVPDVARGIEPHLRAPGQDQLGPGQIGVRQHAVDVLGRDGHGAGVGQQLLLGRGERVRPAPQDVVELVGVDAQGRLGGLEAGHRPVGERQDLGRDERGRGIEPRSREIDLLGAGEGPRFPGVEVRLHVRVGMEREELALQLRDQGQGRQQAGGPLPQPAAVGLQSGEPGEEPAGRVLPGRVARVQLGEVPRVLLGSCLRLRLSRHRLSPVPLFIRSL